MRCDPGKSAYTLATYFRLQHNGETVVICKYVELIPGAERYCFFNLHFVPPDAALYRFHMQGI